MNRKFNPKEVVIIPKSIGPILLALLLTVALGASSVMGQTAAETIDFRASDLIGSSVRNVLGNEVGQVEDLLIGVESNEALYAVLSFDSFVSISEGLYPVPFSALLFDSADQPPTFRGTVVSLADAPNFSEDNWPDTTNVGWDNGLRGYWSVLEAASTLAEDESVALAPPRPGEEETPVVGDILAPELKDLLSSSRFRVTGDQMSASSISGVLAPKLERILSAAITSSSPGPGAGTQSANDIIALKLQDMITPTLPASLPRPEGLVIPGTPAAEGAVVPFSIGEPAIRASELLGLSVENAQGEEQGRIEDFLVDVESDQVRYAVVSVEGRLGVGEDLVPIPLSALNLGVLALPVVDVIASDISEDAFLEAPGFGQADWPDTTLPGWDEEIADFWEEVTAG